MELSDKIKKELDLTNDIKDKRQRLTELNKEGYDIKPYLISVLECENSIPEENGFGFNRQFGTSGGILRSYNLDNELYFFFEEQKDGTYTKWP